MTSESGMRVSDRDRERAMEAVCSAYVAGRLDLQEFDDRSGAVNAAKTWGDLSDLTGDLPEGRALIASGPDAGWHRDAGAARQAPGHPFMPLTVMAAIWLTVAALGHVAASIPLVLLSMFVLLTACSKTAPPRQSRGPAMQIRLPAAPRNRETTHPAGRAVSADVTTRRCSRTARHRGRCHRRR